MKFVPIEQGARHRRKVQRAAALATMTLACVGPAVAADYDESVMGDLSGNRFSPTF